MKPRVLLVEDDPARREIVARVLAEGHDCRAVGTVEEAFAAIAEGAWEVAVVDYDLSQGGSGLEVLQVLRETAPRTLRVVYTGYYSESLVRDIARLAHPHAAVDARPVGFLTTLRTRLAELLALPDPERAPRAPDPGGLWLAVAPASVAFLADLKLAAESDAPVFLFGEPGAGTTQACRLLRAWRSAWARAQGRHEPEVEPAAILRVPPLRERRQDVPALARRFLLDDARAAGEPPRRLTPDALEDLARREWRGNLTELHGVLTRARHQVGARMVIGAQDLPHDHPPAWRPSQYAKDDGQRECVLRQLRMARNVTGAARLEGCTRANYIRMMRRLGVMRADVTVDAAPVDDED